MDAEYKSFIDYVNPLSRGFKAACVEVNRWSLAAKISVIALSLLIGVPTFVIGGVIFFRWSATHFKKNKEHEDVIPPVIEENPDLSIEESELQDVDFDPVVESELPKNNVVIGSVWKFFVDTFYESTERKCIEWKIRKYEGVLLALHVVIKKRKIFSKSDSITVMTEKLIQACEAIEDEDRFEGKNIQKHLKIVREAYEVFIKGLREALQKTPYDKALLSLSEFLFTGIDLCNECTYTLKVFNNINKIPLFGKSLGENEIFSTNLSAFPEEMQNLLSKINRVPQEYKTPHISRVWNSIKGSFNVDFDPYIQGNVPHVLYTLDVQGKKVKALGMGTPTRENTTRQVFLNEEFSALINSYKSKGKKHLFVLNQDATSGKKIVKKVTGNETPRCDLILDAQDESEGALYCIALSKNSTFYRQESSKKVDAESFKQELSDQFFKLDRYQSGCYIPESIKNMEFDGKSFQNYFNEIVEAIHADLFEGKEYLTKEERKIFIEVFYDILIKALVAGLDVDSFNISCKDAIDRAAGSNAQLYSNIALINSGGLLQKIKNKIAELMNVRALFARKRAAIEERCDRFTETLAHVIKNVSSYQNLDRKFFAERKIVIVN